MTKQSEQESDNWMESKGTKIVIRRYYGHPKILKPALQPPRISHIITHCQSNFRTTGVGGFCCCSGFERLSKLRSVRDNNSSSYSGVLTHSAAAANGPSSSSSLMIPIHQSLSLTTRNPQVSPSSLYFFLLPHQAAAPFILTRYHFDRVIAMVSQNTPSSSSGILHHFIASDPNPNQTQFNQRLDAYISAMRCNDTFPQSPPAGLPSIQSLGERMSGSIDLLRPLIMAEDSEISHTRHLVDLLGTAPESGNQTQRLSLSLGSQMLLSRNQYRQRSYNQDIVSPHYSISGEEGRERYNSRGAGQASDHYAYSTSSLVNTVRSSKYLKAVQSLLQEVVDTSDYEAGWDDCGKKLSARGRRAVRLSSELSTELCSNGFLSDQKQESHLKFAKLLSLLEEVESRYERYYHQMQEVVSSFELIAGAGSARCYTGLALHAMSKHFFSLSDAILSQIHLTKKKKHQDSPRLSSGASQLTLFDQDRKHNRLTLQQIGLLHGQRQAWRPIRGLPETSVVILRAWLFEHFLHPYPTESEKLILSSQTGLSKNQVSNWFINARVRLWKPMIEEMYKEEFADSSDSDLLGRN